MSSKHELKISFNVYGLITSREFQLAKTYIERLRARLPQEYCKPNIVSMLDLDWNLFILKIRREIGGEKLWTLKKQVVIFKNEELLGDDEDLLEFVGSKYRFTIFEEFECIGAQQFINYIEQQKVNGNTFVYFTIAVDQQIIGTLLFELYATAVPTISKIFLKTCAKKVGGYSGTCIQRIVWPSWIQCGGWCLEQYKVPCENYSISHNKRGVLSMCNNGKHIDNCTQFFVTLEPTPWMDYKYVAFGQLINGDHVLRILQNIPTLYEEPLKKIDIVKSGELDLRPTFGPKDLSYLKDFLATRDPISGLHPDVTDVRDCSSDYSLGSDNQPPCDIIDYLLEMYREENEENGGAINL
ncbi:hypothetical protein PPYR_12868 [Photinus pyralis]|uniref:PPIase cyclophilin-type domain-containing protein n=1 Tax=Photinus pyralis TaxID=7054 RepID=A0A5N4A7L9_PHOPY|nr:probable inactive peptidyl-prolyl cis-trans isomerase-like 6 [Photinus pyralis]KAB0793248.1 hypothetical protein PPYR_12868 [Photinus pyralis]